MTKKCFSQSKGLRFTLKYSSNLDKRIYTLSIFMIITSLFTFFPADDTEYGYHSASSSSAEHHAQLGPSTSNQMVTQQQQNNLQQLQGQIQNQVSL